MFSTLRSVQPSARHVWLARLLIVLSSIVVSLAPARPCMATSELVSNLKSDERVIFFPAEAWRKSPAGDGAKSAAGAWQVSIRAWVFEGNETLRASPRWMLVIGAMLGGVSGDERDILNRRLAPFTVDDERNKRIVIEIGNECFELNPTQANGHSVTELEIPDSVVQRASSDGRIEFRCVLAADDTRKFTGQLHLIEPTGLSVISDIDDTIKRSDVLDKSKLLRNTFLLPFVAVEGMAPPYRKWHAAGARFHLVSAGPWQLYEPLAEFVRASEFPPVTFHMREFRLNDASLLEFARDPQNAKVEAIARILRRWPQRRFVLVGDSGEKDPEAYGAVARQFPEQVAAILIRNVTGQARDDARYREALRDVPDDRWQLFTDPATLPTEFPR